MRTIAFYIAAIITFFLIANSSKAQSVKVNLKENEEFIYEWTEKFIFITEKENPITDHIKNVRFSISINKIENNKILFTAKILQDKVDFPSKGAANFIDYKFPELYDFAKPDISTDDPEEILFNIKFLFQLDLNKRTIELLNRFEILEQCHSKMVEKGYSEEKHTAIIDLINKKGLQRRSDLFLYPFLFFETKTDTSKIYNGKLDRYFSVSKITENELELNTTKDSISKNISCSLNLKNGLVTHFKTEFTENRKEQNFGYPPINRSKKTEEIKLLNFSIGKQQNIIVCGHIENPVSNQIVLFTLSKSFGFELEDKTVILDKKGNFRLKTRFENKGLVVVTNPNKNRNIPGPIILLYAEPGDSIYFQTNLVAQEFQKKFYLRNDSSEIEIKKYIVPEKILFSGDRKQEAEILNKFQELSGLLPFQIRRNFLYVDNGRSDAEIYLDAIPKIDQILEKSDLNLRSESAIYLQHEMQAFLYSNLYTSRQSESEDNWIMELGTIIANDILKKTIYSQLDTFNIHRIYNDYGIFSRSLTSKYVNYKYSRLNPINNNSFSGFDFRYGRLNEPEQLIQLAKMVLNGSPLYREIADQYYFYSLKPFNEIINKSKWWPEAEETFSLILEKCNDEVFIRDLEAIQSTSLKWENMRYIPDVKLLNLQKQETTLQSFIAKKATIFYTAYDWSAARYEMDELAPQFPEINFVLINQGSNYDLWKEWNDRAEPKAIQLFLLTDSIQLEDLFQDKLNNYLIYNQSGERIGNEHELTRAVQIAKGMVKAPKKELNKSTLQGIIIFLVGSMLLVLILFLAYKYRMKQRLKNQAQEKRLRELQMAAIRAQMNPHFLFNSLNSVQNLIQQNKAREAHLYLSDFAGLIRKVLRNSDKEEVPLAEELEMMEQYLNLEKLRFDFDYTIEVDKGIDQSLFMVPSMILQPVAENALLHGLQHKTGEKKIMIRISKTENGILISIEDNGIGLEEAKKLKTKSNGVGLRMNEERIQMMKEKYGGNYSIKMIDLTEQGREGTLIEIFIPDEQ